MTKEVTPSPEWAAQTPQLETVLTEVIYYYMYMELWNKGNRRKTVCYNKTQNVDYKVEYSQMLKVLNVRQLSLIFGHNIVLI